MELGEERGPRLIVCNQMAKYLLQENDKTQGSQAPLLTSGPRG